jgi:hypothetical protein
MSPFCPAAIDDLHGGQFEFMASAEAKERLRRRERFLRELAEARALRARVTPRRSRRDRLRTMYRLLTYNS